MKEEELYLTIQGLDSAYSVEERTVFAQPIYSPELHYLHIARNPYFRALVDLRHMLKMATDFYWGSIVGAKNVDLFMMTPSVSSPMGPGSDSEAVDIQFGALRTYLVDSSQFGFEPILLNGIEKLYCYLPSIRGENPDARHINQFFHCEAEIRGTMQDLTPLVEGYIKELAAALLHAPNVLQLISENYELTQTKLRSIQSADSFKHYSFEDMIAVLTDAGKGSMVRVTEFGRDITSEGELEFMRLIETQTPVWIDGYDRNRVPFYLKPDPSNPAKVINADLLFPPLIPTSFGGEVVGAGQRQDNTDQMYESLVLQGISSDPYEWYINLRREPAYSTTSGFGLGVERFLAWMLNKADIKDVILYPRLKDVRTLP